MRIPAAPGAFPLTALLCLFIAASCHRDEAAEGQSNPPTAGVRVRTLTLGAFTTPREAYGKALLPAFRTLWRQKTGEELRFEESYLGSVAQARAIIAGFEADVAALSLEPDVQKIVAAGLIKHDWKKALRGGMVTRSIVVIGVRPGNPKNIHSGRISRAPTSTC
jgi:sulfate transport system substrate-binding protein